MKVGAPKIPQDEARQSFSGALSELVWKREKPEFTNVNEDFERRSQRRHVGFLEVPYNFYWR